MAVLENDYAAYIQTEAGEVPLRDLDAQEKIGSLSEDLICALGGDDIIKNINLNLKQGTIRPTGQVVEQSYTVYNSFKIDVSNGEKLVFDTSKFKVNIFGYDNVDDVASANETGFIQKSPIDLIALMKKSFVNICIRYADNSDLTPSDVIGEIAVFRNIENKLVSDSELRAKLEEYSKGFAAKTVGKNRFDKNSTTIVSGKYIEYISGIARPNDAYEYAIIPCEPNTNYVVNTAYCQLAWYSDYPIVVSPTNFIGGANITKDNKTFETSSDAKYIALSYPKTAKNTLQLEIGNKSTDYEPYTLSIDGSDIKNKSISADKLSFDIDTETVNKIVVDINGSGDYTNLRSALESIADSSKKNKYIVYVKEGIYNVKSYYNDSEWSVENSSFVGLFVPDFTTLVGLGDKEKVIITAEDTIQRAFVSTLNLRNTSGLKNLTVKAKNLRYTIHDDYAQPNQENYERVLDNCDFHGETLQRVYVYGCGIKEGANYKITNCKFITDVTSNFSFLIHNNTGWSKCSNVLIENCRFEPVETSFGIVLSSLGTDTKLTYVTLKGNKLKRLRLNENSATYKGITFKVNGYGNSITDAVQIINSDDVDYSSYVDLI